MVMQWLGGPARTRRSRTIIGTDSNPYFTLPELLARLHRLQSSSYRYASLKVEEARSLYVRELLTKVHNRALERGGGTFSARVSGSSPTESFLSKAIARGCAYEYNYPGPYSDDH